MEGGLLVMSQRERSRLVMMSRVREKAMTIKDNPPKSPFRKGGFDNKGVSYRKNQRIYKRYTQVVRLKAEVI